MIVSGFKTSPLEAAKIVQGAMKHGRFPSWDYAPHYDAAKVYVRGGTDPSTTATKQRGRFPYVAVTPPQHPRHSKK